MQWTGGAAEVSAQKTNQRCYTDEDYRLWRNIPIIERKKIVYCRASSAGQKEDLRSQISAMQTFCLGAGVAIDEWISEIGSGLNFKRKHFLNLMEQIENNEISHLYTLSKQGLMQAGSGGRGAGSGERRKLAPGSTTKIFTIYI